jgi:hypothetical protein
MKVMRQGLAWVILVTGLLFWPGGAWPQQTECQGVATHVKAVATGSRTAAVNFSPNGNLDPLPLLETQITIGDAQAV